MKKNLLLLLLMFCLTSISFSKILIPMDLNQSDHLKAYGIAYYVLERGYNVEWLLNYRGGSFLFDDIQEARRVMLLRNVSYENVSPSQTAAIYAEIENQNMERMLLEVAPKIAVYMPDSAMPWDDAVRLSLDYAEIPYTTLYDKEILRGDLEKYDWLHLFHEDFTGQYGKFYSSYGTSKWYLDNKEMNEQLAAELGFDKVWKMKHAVTAEITNYVSNGGFLFAMCAATDTYEIAQAAYGIDIVPAELDGDGINQNAQAKLNYENTFFFKDFQLQLSPYVYEFSNIDTSDYWQVKGAEADYFTLFEFSAKYDPIPTMLTQNHVGVINGFFGQTTGFKRDLIKEGTVLLGITEGTDEVKYIHRTYKKGTVTFYGGHDPEDYQHRVGDPPTDLKLHPSSPGYRLILNNVLFPAAKKKKLKT